MSIRLATTILQPLTLSRSSIHLPPLLRRNTTGLTQVVHRTQEPVEITGRTTHLTGTLQCSRIQVVLSSLSSLRTGTSQHPLLVPSNSELRPLPNPTRVQVPARTR